MKNIFTLLDIDDSEEKKICMHCDTEKPVSKFYQNRTGIDNRCIECHSKRKRDVEKLKRNPSVPKMPDVCDCCGRTNPKKLKIAGKMGYNLSLDHYYDSNDKPYFRGWICKQCNSGIGYLGDNVKSVFNAFTYILKSVPEHDRPDVYKSMIDTFSQKEQELFYRDFLKNDLNYTDEQISKMIEKYE
jgi:hypothetical protein